ncbi:hypothetical protein Golomagni_08120, partial [Golovinomyces magnicellulatus]
MSVASSSLCWSSVGTFLGWLLWERWVSEEEDEEEKLAAAAAAAAAGAPGVVIGTHGAGGAMAGAMSIARTGSLRRRNRAGSLRRPLPPLPTESTASLPTSANTSAASSTTNLVMSAPKPPPTSSTSIPSTATAGTTPTANGSTDTKTNGSKSTTPIGTTDLLYAAGAKSHSQITYPFNIKRQYLGYLLLVAGHQHVLFRLLWRRGRQVSSLAVYECCVDGIDGVGEPATLDETGLQSDLVQHRGLWALPGVQAAHSTPKLEVSFCTHCCTCHGSGIG